MPTDIHELPAFRDRIKTCGRCHHTWYSHSANPVRCPGCGTYHWQGEPIVNSCAVCGHEWFSRTTQIPLRCPSCKTRSWKSEGYRGRTRPTALTMDGTEKAIVDMYLEGQGCVNISIKTGVALSSVVRIVRANINDGFATRM